MSALLRLSLLFALVGALPALAQDGRAAGAQGPDVTPAANAAGLKVLERVTADFDGDGKQEILAACSGDRGVLLAVFSSEAQPKLLHAFPPVGGRTLKGLEVRHLVPPEGAQEALLEVYDENPDEKVKRIRIYTGYRKPREIFTSVIFRSKDKAKRPLHETIPGVVEYGDAREGWYFLDLEKDGSVEVIVRDKPQVLQVKRTGGDAFLLTGVREKVWEIVGRPDTAVYAEREKVRFNDFLPAYPVVGVSASSVWIPKDVKQELESEALATALYAAADGAKADSLPEVPKIDLTPFWSAAADKDLSTFWAEDVDGLGAGEWVELDLGEKRPVRMVRVVAGCVADARAFKNHNVPSQLEISFGRNEKAFVDRDEPERPLRPAIAILEVPTPDKKFAKQTLVFFKGDEEADKVRVTLKNARRLGKANRTCISEVSVH